MAGSPALRLVDFPSVTFEIDGYAPITLRRMAGLDLRLMQSDDEFAPFTIHFKRHIVPVVDGWGFRRVTRWGWSVGWHHGQERQHISYINVGGKPIADFAECRLQAVTMAVAWMHSDNPQRFLDDQWRRTYGLREAERLRRGIASVIAGSGLD